MRFCFFFFSDLISMVHDELLHVDNFHLWNSFKNQNISLSYRSEVFLSSSVSTFSRSPVPPAAAQTLVLEEDRWVEILNCFLSVRRVSSSLFALSSCRNPACSCDDAFITEHGEIKRPCASSARMSVCGDRCGTVRGVPRCLSVQWWGQRRRTRALLLSLWRRWCTLTEKGPVYTAHWSACGYVVMKPFSIPSCLIIWEGLASRACDGEEHEKEYFTAVNLSKHVTSWEWKLKRQPLNGTKL